MRFKCMFTVILCCVAPLPAQDTPSHDFTLTVAPTSIAATNWSTEIPLTLGGSWNFSPSLLPETWILAEMQSDQLLAVRLTPWAQPFGLEVLSLTLPVAPERVDLNYRVISEFDSAQSAAAQLQSWSLGFTQHRDNPRSEFVDLLCPPQDQGLGVQNSLIHFQGLASGFSSDNCRFETSQSGQPILVPLPMLPQKPSLAASFSDDDPPLSSEEAGRIEELLEGRGTCCGSTSPYKQGEAMKAFRFKGMNFPQTCDAWADYTRAVTSEALNAWQKAHPGLTRDDVKASLPLLHAAELADDTRNCVNRKMRRKIECEVKPAIPQS